MLGQWSHLLNPKGSSPVPSALPGSGWVPEGSRQSSPHSFGPPCPHKLWVASPCESFLPGTYANGWWSCILKSSWRQPCPRAWASCVPVEIALHGNVQASKVCCLSPPEGCHHGLCFTEAHQSHSWSNQEAKQRSVGITASMVRWCWTVRSEVLQERAASPLKLLCPQALHSGTVNGALTISDCLQGHSSIVLENSSCLLLRWLIHTMFLSFGPLATPLVFLPGG